METTIAYWGIYGGLYRDYRVYILGLYMGIMEKKMENPIV